MLTWLIAIRTGLGLSTYQAATLCGISQAYYWAIENGTRGTPLRVSTAKKIADGLGFDWHKFYEGSDTD